MVSHVERDLTLRPAHAEDVRALQAMVDADAADRWTRVLYDGGRSAVSRAGAGLEVVERDGAVIGLVEARTDPVSGTVELGWWIEPAQRGRHTASRVVRLAVDEALRSGVPRVEARVATANHSSRWVAASAGLRLEAGLHEAWDDDTVAGGRLDVEVWRLVAGEAPLDGQPDLTAGVLHLRPLAPSDADALARGMDDGSVRRWLHHTPIPYGREDALAYVAGTLGSWAAGTGAVWGFCDSTTGELLGCAGLHGRRPDPLWRELGWHCFPWARGRGHTARAVGAVARWGRGALGLTRVDARIEIDNAPSQRVAADAGLVHEATLEAAVTARDGRAVTAQVWRWAG